MSILRLSLGLRLGLEGTGRSTARTRLVLIGLRISLLVGMLGLIIRGLEVLFVLTSLRSIGLMRRRLLWLKFQLREPRWNTATVTLVVRLLGMILLFRDLGLVVGGLRVGLAIGTLGPIGGRWRV
jgi:hypothetical protein